MCQWNKKLLEYFPLLLNSYRPQSYFSVTRKKIVRKFFLKKMGHLRQMTFEMRDKWFILIWAALIFEISRAKLNNVYTNVLLHVAICFGILLCYKQKKILLLLVYFENIINSPEIYIYIKKLVALVIKCKTNHKKTMLSKY